MADRQIADAQTKRVRDRQIDRSRDELLGRKPDGKMHSLKNRHTDRWMDRYFN